MLSIRLIVLCCVPWLEASGSQVDAMVERAESLLEGTALAGGEAGVLQRHGLWADGSASADGIAGTDVERHGAYGEFPLRGMAELLEHPAVTRVMAGIGKAHFVDLGSGAGRLLLAVAAMDAGGKWGRVTGIEASGTLHDLATRTIGSVGAGDVVTAINEDLFGDNSRAAREALADADVTFVYSTAFPSEDGLRLPELSAALACSAKEGSLVITTDKWLVGDRAHGYYPVSLYHPPARPAAISTT